MFKQTLSIVLLAALACLAGASSHHQQVHLSFGQSIDQMLVTWVTKHNDQKVHVRYGRNNSDEFEFKAKASTTKYVNPGREGRIMYVHRAILRELEPNQLYKYRPVSAQALGSVYSFRSRKVDNTEGQTRFAMLADMGLEGTVLPRLTAEVERDEYDMIFHVGDLAYDLQ